MSIADEFRTRNFSIYAQWLGIFSMILCFALGISSFFTLSVMIIIWAAVTLAFAFIIIFIEIPLLLRICPTSSGFDSFIRKIATNYLRAAAYAAMAVFEFLLNIGHVTRLNAVGVFLALTAICYALAGLKGQDFVGSKTLGGAGVAQMIV